MDKPASNSITRRKFVTTFAAIAAALAAISVVPAFIVPKISTLLKEDRMNKYAIATTNAPSAIGPYSQAIKAEGASINVSGQIPIDPATGNFAGDDIGAQTAQCLKNIAAILEEAGTDMSSVVETTVMLTDMDDFTAMNEVYEGFFEEPYPARAAFQVVALPKGAKIEIKCVARVI